MATQATPKEKRTLIKFIFNHYFDGDSDLFTKVTGYSAARLRLWLAGHTKPRQASLDYILHCKFSPDFQIVCEFKELDPEEPVLTQIRKHLGHHIEQPGIYAFYDCRAQLLYIGKAGKLCQEITNALRARADDVELPSGIKNRRKMRWELVSYFSAYSVPSSLYRDHPKHVESLLLRISKPPLNKQIGRLTKVPRPKA